MIEPVIIETIIWLHRTHNLIYRQSVFSQPRVVNTYNESLGYTEYNASLQMNYQLALLNSYLKQTPSPTWDVNENGAARSIYHQ